MLETLGQAADAVASWLAGLSDVVVAIAGTPWSLLLMAVFTAIDGFFPPIPSESIVIALASLSMSGEGPPLWAILPVAAVGAFVGDVMAYTIGTRAAMRSFRWCAAARYIPIGRVAVNMSAGALGFGRKRFMGFAAIAAVSWAVYSTLLGIGAGAVIKDQPMLAVVVGVVLGIVLGTVIDAVMRKVLGTPSALPAPDDGERLEPRGDAVDPERPAGDEEECAPVGDRA